MAGHSSEKWVRLGEGTLPTEDAEVGLGHIVTVPTYRLTYQALIILTLLTVWAATQDFGIMNLAVALGIASLKAAVVTLIFMHLTWESKIAWGIVIYPLFIFVLILGSTLGDVMEKKVPMPTGGKLIAPQNFPHTTPTAESKAATPEPVKSDSAEHKAKSH